MSRGAICGGLHVADMFGQIAPRLGQGERAAKPFEKQHAQLILDVDDGRMLFEFGSHHGDRILDETGIA